MANTYVASFSLRVFDVVIFLNDSPYVKMFKKILCLFGFKINVF